ncbi:hypothetical protein EXIGLDRAFT_727445 [Exidia glandulosa HHB12029]|uniref:Uncharacterized protein n=1 Tax=Exidia glandulosa HHB12029 TaxID=1314781 RepID=A0A165DDH6_EXIGL|nr:hypothetical protein EXIGLDRAFT_727445 [Exidia glandulosa HHB12029]
MSSPQTSTPEPAPAPEHKPVPELDGHTKSTIRTFLSSPFSLPVWNPDPTLYTASDRQRLVDLHIPTVFTTHDELYPDLNLYALGNLEVLDPEFTSRFDDFVSGDSHIALVNTSGSGKTRLLFETVHRRWGLYFNSSYEGVSNPLGSFDWTSSINRLKFKSRGPQRTAPISPGG